MLKSIKSLKNHTQRPHTSLTIAALPIRHADKSDVDKDLSRVG